MITDIQLAQACADIYDDHIPWDNRWNVDGVVAARRIVGDSELIVFRGSKTIRDWLRDFAALILYVPNVGCVHAGFYRGLTDILYNALPVVSKNIYVTGHSLGAAHAWIFAQLLNHAGYTPRAVVAFAPPRPGLIELREKLCLSGATLRSYANAHDPVPRVPFFPFIHPVQPIMIDEMPDEGDSTPLARHHMALYQRGVARIATEAMKQ